MFLNKAKIKNKLFMQEDFIFLYDLCVYWFNIKIKFILIL